MDDLRKPNSDEFFNPVREKARQEFDRIVSELPAELTVEQLLAFLKLTHFHANYYAWLVQYIQTACFLMKQTVGEAAYTVVHEPETFTVLFTVINKDRTLFVEFTGRVNEGTILTAINQKLEAKPFPKEATE